MDARDYLGAAEQYEEILRRKPDSLQAQFNLGLAYQGSGKFVQAKDIWTGAVTNWKDVGGNDQAIVLIIRPQSSGTRATFKQIVLGGADEAAGQALTEDSNGAVTTAVSGTPGATSVVGFAYYQQNKGDLVALQLDGIDATVDNMSNGSYKLQAFGHMYTKGPPDGLVKAFLDYMLSPTVQGTTIPSLFYAPAGT